MRYLLLLMLIGCGRIESTRSIDPILEPYVNTFVEAAGDKAFYPSYWSVKLVDVVESDNPEVIGVCRTALDRFEIEIDRVRFLNLTEEFKNSLVFHEMTHCVFRKPHVEDPHNYMYRYLKGFSLEELRLQLNSI